MSVAEYNARYNRSDKGRANQARYRVRHPDAHRRWRLPKKYGITVEDYEQMLLEQGGACAICRRAETVVMRGKVKPLSVDHDHESGRVRGLLCHECNVGLGKFKDNVARLKAAVTYLEGTPPGG